MEPTTNPLIVIADEFADGRDLLAEYLTYLGFAVLKAADGVAALQLAREHRPVLVFLDLALPALSGLDVAKAITGDPALRDTIVVAVTGWVMPSDEQQAREAGFHAFVRKPYDLRTFGSAVRAIMRDGRSALPQLAEDGLTAV